jgi:hypothetical protein
MPVVGDELAALVSDGVEVAANLDAPTVGVLAYLVFLSDVDRERPPCIFAVSASSSSCGSSERW